MITLIDYGMGNIGSIVNMVKKIGGDITIASNVDQMRNATKLVLPGVGSFDNGMKNLHERGMVDLLNQKVLKEKVPILGICLGMQLITKTSEEGVLPGLGWIDAHTVKFKSPIGKEIIKIPHMGWNMIHLRKKSAIFEDMFEDPCFYFVHSYYVDCRDAEAILTTTHYGAEFVSSIQKENIFAVQFHPEKSHKYGLRLFKNFYEKV
jgi:imidazole glycerol-phosphate synthase subunit HisH